MANIIGIKVHFNFSNSQKKGKTKQSFYFLFYLWNRIELTNVLREYHLKHSESVDGKKDINEELSTFFI